jgi:hypothetical protein
LEFLIEHGLGKVPQRHELTGEEGGPLEIVPWLPAASKVPQLEEGRTTDADSWRSAQTKEDKETEEIEEDISVTS